jgi:PAS domain S-box-containing protein
VHRLDRSTGSLSEGEQFRRLVEGVTDYAIYMLDPEGRVSSWNAGAQRIKGYRPDEIIGRSFATFYTEADRLNGEPQRALAVATSEGRFEKEALRVRKDGSQFWAHVIIDAIRENGELVGFAKITRDITERVKAQRELELAREQLFQSQKMEAIGQLTGGVAHDFNNLLMAVLGSLELLRKRLPMDDPKLAQLIDNAELGAERGRALTQRMLAFARRQELELKPVDLSVLLSGMRELLSRTLGPQVEITFSVPAGLPMATTDAGQIETAILNLAVNARDAMPEGGAISVSAAEATPPAELALPTGRYVRLSVTDTGEGMDSQTLARAAEPFFTTKGVGKGTGLGLSMVHGLAEQSGGRLALTSRPGDGTTATLWLPAAACDDVAAAAEAKPVPAPSAAAQQRPLVIVAVDDDPLVLMNTTAMLEDLGHTVIDALSGPEALQKLDGAGIVDLVITDHAMPAMTGSQLAQQIRERWPRLPVVLATGYAELPAGGNEELPKLNKPFSQAELAKVVGRATQAAG